MKQEKKLIKQLILLIFLVLAVRLIFLAFFHHQIFLGPSTQFDQAFVALNIHDGEWLKTYKNPPQVVEPSDPSRLIDPENYLISSLELVPYIKEVTGYALFLAFVWKISGAKLWIYAQLAQIIFDVLVAFGLFVLTRKFFGPRPAFFAVLGFGFLFFEARVNVVPYKDIFILYFVLIITFFSSFIFFQKRKALLWFFLICLFTGLGFYFMPSLVLYPFFFIAILLIFKRINLKAGVAYALMGLIVIGLLGMPYWKYVGSHRSNPEIQQPLFWYRFWLGTKIQVFYSTQEERFEDYFKEKIEENGLSLEEICKEEFLEFIKTHPVKYTLNTLKKLSFGTLLVYANAGDCTYDKSWSNYHNLHPQASFMDYARNYPLRILGMILGTLSASVLFPLSFVALIILIREKRWVPAIFFFHIPCYFILLHMFFHYEARYLLGTLPGYLPLIGFLFSKFRMPKRKSEKKSEGKG